MIPPPRHLSDASARTAAVPVPESAFRRAVAGDHVTVGSYNPSDSLLGTSPATSPPSTAEDGELEFSEESSAGRYSRSSSGKLASSFPGVGLDSTMAKVPENLAAQARSFAANTEAKEPLAGNTCLIATYLLIFTAFELIKLVIRENLKN